MFRSSVRPFSARAFLPFALLASCLFAACTSSGSSDAVRESVRVAFRDLRGGGTPMVIVNDGFLIDSGIEGETPAGRRKEYYSMLRTGVQPKVASDELMGKLLDFFDHQDFETYAINGPAPANAGGGVRQTLEVSSGGRSRHLVAMPGMEPARSEAFRETVRGYARTFNEIVQLQTVPADFEFEGTNVPASRRR